MNSNDIQDDDFDQNQPSKELQMAIQKNTNNNIDSMHPSEDNF